MNNFCIKCGQPLTNGTCYHCLNNNNSNTKSSSNKFWAGFWTGASIVMFIMSIFCASISQEQQLDNCPTTQDNMQAEQSSEQTEQSSEQTQPSNGKCYATLDKFNAIQTDMTYQEVVNIVGCDGELTMQTGDDSYNLKYYVWKSKRGIGNMVISFENDYVSGKTQIGLQ